MNHAEQMKALEKVLPNLHSRDQSFGISLVDQWKRRGGLSEKQWPWVSTLLDKVGVSPGENPAAKPKPTVNVGALTRLNELFDSAKESGIQFPKMRLKHGEDKFALGLSGPNSRYPGQINIKSGDMWYGRIDRAGNFTPGSEPLPAGWMETIQEIAKDPLESMKVQGRRTGNCCLCGRELTNHESIELGIGPVCASNWGVG